MSSNNNDTPAATGGAQGQSPQPSSASSGSSVPPTQAGTPSQSNQPQSGKKAGPASNQSNELRRTPSTSESASEWAKRVHEIQFSRLSEEDRQALQRRADRAAELHAKAKKMAMVKQRVNESKTVSYNALQQSSAWRPEEQSTRSMGTVDLMNAREQHWASRAMEMVPIEARRSAPMAPAVVTRAEDEALMRDDSEEEIPLQLDALAGAGGAPLPIVVAATPSEDEVLKSLRVEPKTDEECASKFTLYEAFSAKLSVIRTDLETLLEETLPDLPPIPREAVAASMKRLDDREHRGIFDQSRYWFVHDMMQKAMANSDVMKKISNDVTLKVKLASELQQSDCPICLAPFDVPSRRERSSGEPNALPATLPPREDSDAPMDPVVPITLGCCHKVCEVCWEHWCALRGGPANAFCPLCRQVDFVRALQGGD